MQAKMVTAPRHKSEEQVSQSDLSKMVMDMRKQPAAMTNLHKKHVAQRESSPSASPSVSDAEPDDHENENTGSTDDADAVKLQQDTDEENLFANFHKHSQKKTNVGPAVQGQLAVLVTALLTDQQDNADMDEKIEKIHRLDNIPSSKSH